jgi:hypothetical protein
MRELTEDERTALSQFNTSSNLEICEAFEPYRRAKLLFENVTRRLTQAEHRLSKMTRASTAKAALLSRVAQLTNIRELAIKRVVRRYKTFLKARANARNS